MYCNVSDLDQASRSMPGSPEFYREYNEEGNGTCQVPLGRTLSCNSIYTDIYTPLPCGFSIFTHCPCHLAGQFVFFSLGYSIWLCHFVKQFVTHSIVLKYSTLYRLKSKTFRIHSWEILLALCFFQKSHLGVLCINVFSSGHTITISWQHLGFKSNLLCPAPAF